MSTNISTTNINATQSVEAKAKRTATLNAKRDEKAATRGYSLPLTLTCSVTKKQIRYTSENYISKVISKYGSLENLQKNFVSREGKRIQSGKQSAS